MDLVTLLSTDLLQAALKAIIKEGVRHQTVELRVGPQQTPVVAAEKLEEPELDALVASALDPKQDVTVRTMEPPSAAAAAGS